MSRTYTATAVAASKVTMSAKHYDPLAHLGTILPNEKMRARVVSSLAWYIDRQLVSEVRSLFFKLYEELSDSPDSGIDSYNDFLAVMAKQEARETNMIELGYMEGSGVGTIRKLIAVRDEFHDAASAVSERHKVPTIEQLMHEDKPMKIDSLSRLKTVQLAKHMAKGDEAKEARYIEELMKRKERRAIEMHERRMELAPALSGMLSFISNTSLIDDANFSDLPADMQKRCIEQLVKIIERTVGELSDDRTVDEFEYVKILIEGEEAAAAVCRVLAQNTFASLEQPMGQVTQAFVRAQDQREQLDAALAPA